MDILPTRLNLKTKSGWTSSDHLQTRCDNILWISIENHSLRSKLHKTKSYFACVSMFAGMYAFVTKSEYKGPQKSPNSHLLVQSAFLILKTLNVWMRKSMVPFLVQKKLQKLQNISEIPFFEIHPKINVQLISVMSTEYENNTPPTTLLFLC